MYAQGHGVPQDHVQAHVWFKPGSLAGGPLCKGAANRGFSYNHQHPCCQQRARVLARKQIKERDEFEAFEQAAVDLIRLDRYERQAWSRHKRAIRACMNIKLCEKRI
jgi:hypothetical protein